MSFAKHRGEFRVTGLCPVSPRVNRDLGSSLCDAMKHVARFVLSHLQNLLGLF